MASRKFAPLPIRAIPDKNLTLIHMRVLSAIAKHDGMSLLRGKGQGCWASTKTLAEACDSHVTNVSTAIHELVRLGYLTRDKHPTRQKTWILRVIYESHDLLSDKSCDLPTDKLSQQVSSISQEDLPDTRVDLSSSVELICQTVQKSHKYHQAIKQNILPEGEDILLKQEKSSSEEAPMQSVAVASRERIATQLRLTERQLKSGKPIQLKSEIWHIWLRDTHAWLENLVQIHEFDDPIHGWAYRLQTEFEFPREGYS